MLGFGTLQVVELGICPPTRAGVGILHLAGGVVAIGCSPRLKLGFCTLQVGLVDWPPTRAEVRVLHPAGGVGQFAAHAG